MSILHWPRGFLTNEENWNISLKEDVYFNSHLSREKWQSFIAMWTEGSIWLSWLIFIIIWRELMVASSLNNSTTRLLAPRGASETHPEPTKCIGTNNKHCQRQNGPKACNTWLIKHFIVQSRSFNKHWNFGKGSARFCLAKAKQWLDLGPMKKMYSDRIP